MEILLLLLILHRSEESSIADHFGDSMTSTVTENKKNQIFDFNIFSDVTNNKVYIIRKCTYINMHQHPIRSDSRPTNVLIETSLFENCNDPGSGGAIYIKDGNKIVLDKVCAYKCTAVGDGHFLTYTHTDFSVYKTTIYSAKNKNNIGPQSTTIEISGNSGCFKNLNCSFNKAILTSALNLIATGSLCINYSIINNNKNAKQIINIVQDKVRTFSCNFLNNRGENLFNINSNELALVGTSIYGNGVTNVFFGSGSQPSILLSEVYIDSDKSVGIRTISYSNKVVSKSSVNMERIISCGIDPVPMTAVRKVEQINNVYKI